MHELNVLILGPNSLVSTLNELKPFLKFNPSFNILDKNFEIILFHNAVLENKAEKEFILDCKSIKICASNKKKILIIMMLI